MQTTANGTTGEGARGGQGGIRTHGELAPTAVFKTAALNHSATCPCLSAHSRNAAKRKRAGDVCLAGLPGEAGRINRENGYGCGTDRRDRQSDQFLSDRGRFA